MLFFTIEVSRVSFPFSKKNKQHLLSPQKVSQVARKTIQPGAGDVFFRLPGLCHPKTTEFHGSRRWFWADGLGFFCRLGMVMEFDFSGDIVIWVVVSNIFYFHP